MAAKAFIPRAQKDRRGLGKDPFWWVGGVYYGDLVRWWLTEGVRWREGGFFAHAGNAWRLLTSWHHLETCLVQHCRYGTADHGPCSRHDRDQLPTRLWTDHLFSGARSRKSGIDRLVG